MVMALRKSGVFIEADKVFNMNIQDKSSNGEITYIFSIKYDTYYKFFTKLLKNDALTDLNDSDNANEEKAQKLPQMKHLAINK